MRRRDALLIGGAMAVAIAIPPILRRLPSDFEFEPIPGVEGFRRVKGGGVTYAGNPFVGIGDRMLPDQAPLPEPDPAEPCQALFGADGWSENVVPVAIFSDFNCPYCKDLETRLIAIRDNGAAVRLIWHEMPLLGPSSAHYAKAVIAARFLGAEERARAYLSSRVLRPGPAALSRMAKELDLLPDMMLREYKSTRVLRTISDSMALGRRMGIPGTPGTVIGRTLVIGAIKDTDIARLIEIEQNEPRAVCL